MKRTVRKVLIVGTVFVFCCITAYYLQCFFKMKTSTVSPANGTRDVYSYTTRGVSLQRVQCSKLLTGDPDSIRKIPRHWRLDGGRDDLFVESCQEFIHRRGFITTAVTPEEQDFPIAFSILVHKDFQQFERLLRAVWRPHNTYCIHVDSSSQPNFKYDVSLLDNCFTNVFVHPHPVNVEWGTYSVLEADLLCMCELLKRHKNWKYFINLTGQEFPLKTNYELFRILKAYGGANDIGGAFFSNPLVSVRWEKSGEPPHNITAIWGPIHIVASRDFVDYALNSRVAKDLLEWVESVVIPDEMFFSSLNYNSHLRAPGSPFDDGGDHKIWSRYKVWNSTKAQCDGKFVRGICIFSVGDLPRLVQSPNLFANKFFYDYQPLAYDCLEGWYHNKVQDEMCGNYHFNVTQYENIWFVKEHL